MHFKHFFHFRKSLTLTNTHLHTNKFLPINLSVTSRMKFYWGLLGKYFKWIALMLKRFATSIFSIWIDGSIYIFFKKFVTVHQTKLWSLNSGDKKHEFSPPTKKNYDLNKVFFLHQTLISPILFWNNYCFWFPPRPAPTPCALTCYLPIHQTRHNFTNTKHTTFVGPCIAIYSYNESQRDALFLKFIFDKDLYMFWTGLLSILTSLAESRHK